MPRDLDSVIARSLLALAESKLLTHRDLTSRVRTELDRVPYRMPIVLVPNSLPLPSRLTGSNWSVWGLETDAEGVRQLYLEYRDGDHHLDFAIQLPPPPEDRSGPFRGQQDFQPPLIVTPEYRSREFEYLPMSVASSPNYLYTANNTDGHVVVWDLHTLVYGQLPSNAQEIALTNAGRAVYRTPNGIFVNDFRQSTGVRINLDMPVYRNQENAISANGRMVALIQQHGVTAIELVDRRFRNLLPRRVGQFNTHLKIEAAYFSHDGERVLIQYKDSPFLDILMSRSPVLSQGARIAAPIPNLQTAAFSEDGTKLITVGAQTIDLWNASTGAHLRVLGSAPANVRSIRLDGTTFQLERRADQAFVRERSPVTVIQPGIE